MAARKQTFLLLFDIFFVLLLCFILLLFTMLLDKGTETARTGSYVLSPLMMSFVAISVAAYMYFMLRSSTHEFSCILKRYPEFQKHNNYSKKQGYDE
jgi:hypothetical protein